MRQDSYQSTINSAKQQIFNQLCAAYLRSKNNERRDIAELGRELKIPEALLAAVVLDFAHNEHQSAIQVLEDQGQTYVKLAESVVEFCADWPIAEKRRPAPSRVEHPLHLFTPGLPRPV
jgi:hypothetical protein